MKEESCGVYTMEPLNKEKHSMTLENPWKGVAGAKRLNVEDSQVLF